MINIVDLSHNILREAKNPKISVDMTCGNGLDTLFLADISNQVYAFDIQETAIKNTNDLLKKYNIENVTVIKESHEMFDKYVKKNIDLVIYNLGYLPKGDKSIKTDASLVLASLKKALDKLNQFGLIVIVIYLHDLTESNQITEFVSSLNSEYDVLKYQVLNKSDCPYIIKIYKN